MKVCFFGSYTNDPTITLFKKKLELQKIEVKECHVDINVSLEQKGLTSVIVSFWKLLMKHRKVGEYDIAVLPLWWGAIQLPLLKIISRKPILYFAHGSPYDALVNDRKKIKSTSFIARSLFFYERLICKLSNLIIKESFAEIEHFTNQMHVDSKKFKPLNIGADESKFPPHPYKQNGEKFVILYFGTFIPLHGVEVIIKAAKILEDNSDIVFKFCGKGQTKDSVEREAKQNNLKNVEFLGFIEHEILQKNIANSDICLGIFGKSDKAEIVVTHKVYQILCSQKPLITMDSKAIREINLENGLDCILVPKQDPNKLAEAILFLKNNEKKRKEIALQGRKTYVEKFSMEITSKRLLGYLNEMMPKSN